MAKSHKKSSGKKAKRPESAWIKHCKAWAKNHNMKYGDVLGDAKCNAAYHAAKKSPSKEKSKKPKKAKSKKSKRAKSKNSKRARK